MDIAHSWGAVLLLDEADVFLEQREHQDVNRNALVSIFLRLLEYFQGILFLTTNRVETFDEAFQSRIHIALKYSELTRGAKREIWKMFLQKVAEGGGASEVFREADFDELAKSKLNGRQVSFLSRAPGLDGADGTQIKNTVKSAQALARHENVPLNMRHVKEVLEVAQAFERDLKGGTGYEEALRSYS
jgi:ATPase family associated with various cellular activities (AAA)